MFDPTTRFAFEADPLGKVTWNECNIVPFELTQIFRQSNKRFAELLNKVRVGDVDDETLDELRKCIRPLSGRDHLIPTNLYPTKVDVNGENKRW